MQSYGKRKNQHSSSSKACTGLPISIMDIRATPNTSHSYTAKTRSRWKRVICGPQNPHNNGQFADKAHAPFSYFITSNPVPETKGRNISQRHPLQKFSQQNAIEKIWINEDYYRKDPRNQIIISTETNHKTTDMTMGRHFPHSNKFHTGGRKCHPPALRRVRYFKIDFSQQQTQHSSDTTHPSLRFALGR